MYVCRACRRPTLTRAAAQLVHDQRRQLQLAAAAAARRRPAESASVSTRQLRERLLEPTEREWRERGAQVGVSHPAVVQVRSVVGRHVPDLRLVDEVTATTLVRLALVGV